MADDNVKECFKKDKGPDGKYKSASRGQVATSKGFTRWWVDKEDNELEAVTKKNKDTPPKGYTYIRNEDNAASYAKKPKAVANKGGGIVQEAPKPVVVDVLDAYGEADKAAEKELGKIPAQIEALNQRKTELEARLAHVFKKRKDAEKAAKKEAK